MPSYDVASNICEAQLGGTWRRTRTGHCGTPVWGSTAKQGLTLVHFSAQPEPFLTQNTL